MGHPAGRNNFLRRSFGAKTSQRYYSSMPRFLPKNDFRARRRVLLKSDFALAEGPEQPPSDKIDKETWNHIVTLPDDVAVRTTNHHGTMIKQISDLITEWDIQCDDSDPIMLPVMFDAHDELDAALYNAITGHYRVSNSATRGALELVTIGTWARLCNKKSDFEQWQEGKLELSLGMACDGLIGATSSLHDELRKIGITDTLFDQKTKTTDGGWVRRAFSGVSDWTHSRPGFTDSSIRKSNGPIYVKGAFNHTAWIQTEIIGLLFVLLLIAWPSTRFNQIAVDLFNDLSKVKSRVTRGAFLVLHPPGAPLNPSGGLSGIRER